MKNKTTPKIPIDFNEIIALDVVLLSKTDAVIDSLGHLIDLKEGMKIYGYMEDTDIDGRPDNLLAHGTVEPNNSGVYSICKWNLPIDENGIQFESKSK